MSAKAKSDAGIRMIRKTSAEDPTKQQQHLEKDKETEKQVTPQKGKESKEPAESAKNAEKGKADETGRKAKEEKKVEEVKIKATITCIAKEKDEKEGSREKPKKNEEIAKKKTPTDREIKMLEVKGVVANEPKKSNEKKKEKSPEGRRRKERKKGKMRREKLRDGMVVRSEAFSWKVISRLGSGGFGDVYRVRKEKSNEGKEEAMDYAMKTEMVMGEKRLLRLKIEVMVLEAIREQLKEDRRTHFVELIDKGKTDTYKFLVMSLVGKSLEDLRRQVLCKNFSKSTAMKISLQALEAISDLHSVGFLHRDIKPANFASSLSDELQLIYVLDFGIARKYRNADGTVKVPRAKASFLGTVRFASRACHYGQEQGRKDDLESWIYLLFDSFDIQHGLQWKKVRDRQEVRALKEIFFKSKTGKHFSVVPKDLYSIVLYIGQLKYETEPNYTYIRNYLLTTAKQTKIDMEKKFDWTGKVSQAAKREKKEQKQESSSSEDNQNTGSDDESDSEVKKDNDKHKKSPTNRSANKKSRHGSSRKPLLFGLGMKKSSRRKGKGATAQGGGVSTSKEAGSNEVEMKNP